MAKKKITKKFLIFVLLILVIGSAFKVLEQVFPDFILLSRLGEIGIFIIILWMGLKAKKVSVIWLASFYSTYLALNLFPAIKIISDLIWLIGYIGWFILIFYDGAMEQE